MIAAGNQSAWLPRAARAFASVALGALLAVASPSWAQTGDADTPRFDILEFVVEGNSVLAVTAIEAAVTPYLGPSKTMIEVEAARGALEKAYQGAGFLTVFVDVPEQRVDEGVVRLQVLEGKVERLSVTGSRYFSQGYIRSRVAALEAGSVPNFNEVQRQLAGVNRTDERRVQPVLRPGRLPGTVEVELKVTDALPLQGRIELNNDHGADTDPLRLTASLSYENLFQLDHAVSLTASVAPREPRQAQSLVVNYSVPLDNGHTMLGYLAASNSAVETLGSTTVLGDGLTLGARYVLPFSGSGGSTHSLSLGADLKQLDEKLTFADSTVTSTPLRYLPMQAAYAGSWSGGGAATQVNATVVAALRKILQRRVACPLADGSMAMVDQFACKRRDATGSFAAFRLDLRHTERLDWGSVALRLAGQLAPNLLPSGEQFSMGGADSVRGYLESEGVGDQGVLGSIELRSVNLAPRLATEGETPWLRDLSLIGFLDVGRTTVSEPLPGQQARVPLLGTGVGLRVATRHGLSASLDVAVPHKATRVTPADRSRAHFKLALRY
jgi:hemolysin activation/secretion protein